MSTTDSRGMIEELVETVRTRRNHPPSYASEVAVDLAADALAYAYHLDGNCMQRVVWLAIQKWQFAYGTEPSARIEPAVEELARSRGFVLAVEVPAHSHDALELRLARDDLRTDGWRGEALRVRDGDQVFVVFVEPRVDGGVKLLQPDPDKLRTAIAEYRARREQARAEVAEIIGEMEIA